MVASRFISSFQCSNYPQLFCIGVQPSSGFGDSSSGVSPSALNGRAATARGRAPGLRRANTCCKPHRAALSALTPRRSARPVGLYDIWRESAYQGRCPWLLQRRTFGAIPEIPTDCSVLLWENVGNYERG